MEAIARIKMLQDLLATTRRVQTCADRGCDPSRDVDPPVPRLGGVNGDVPIFGPLQVINLPFPGMYALKIDEAKNDVLAI